jgi:predicted transcriptional regulator
VNTRSIRIPEDLLYALQLIAEQEDRTVSDCIRQAVKQYADRMLVK